MPQLPSEWNTDKAQTTKGTKVHEGNYETPSCTFVSFLVQSLLESDSLRIGAIHFIVELLEKLGPLLGGKLAFQFFQC